MYTFVSTCVAAFASDAIVPWITNTVQDHKTTYMPYSKVTCLLILQSFTVYAVIMSVIGMFVAPTQVDFVLIRISADVFINYYTTYWFLKSKTTDTAEYYAWVQGALSEEQANADIELSVRDEASAKAPSPTSVQVPQSDSIENNLH